MIRVALLAVVLAASGFGPGFGDIYTRAELDADRARIQTRIAELHHKLTLPQFLTPETADIRNIRINTPDVAPNGDPMGFMAKGGQVYMPVAGLKFIEDLTMAYAWRYLHGGSLESFDEYLAMLRWKPEAAWPHGRYYDPLEALGVPPGAWETDVELASMGTSLRNEAWAFLLAHEMAHVHYSHPGNRVAPRFSQANEAQADAFAMDLLARSETPLLGAYLYFQATVAFYASRADLGSDAEYAAWMRNGATHPVNSRRLLEMARHMQLQSRRFSDPDRREQFLFIGRGLEGFAAMLDDPAQQQLVVRRALEQQPDDLKGE